jgi:spoIIIJ-associated protein
MRDDEGYTAGMGDPPDEHAEDGSHSLLDNRAGVGPLDAETGDQEDRYSDDEDQLAGELGDEAYDALEVELYDEDEELDREEIDGGELDGEELDGEDDERDDEELEDTDFATLAVGADVDEAKRTALAQLRKIVPWVTDADVEYEVVDEGARGGLFGRGRKGAQVEARVRPSARPADADLEPLAEDLRDFLSGVIEHMRLDAHIDVHDDADAVVADLSGPDLGILIGRHGQTIDALQYLCAIAVNRQRKSRRRVVVDAEGYRDRRASSLHAMADRVAQRVSREREPIMLKPMSAAERKVIHLRLKDNPRVETSSEGQEPNRAVVVSPRSQH